MNALNKRWTSVPNHTSNKVKSSSIIS